MPSGSYDFWVEASSSTSKKTCTVTLIVQGQPRGVIPNPFTPNGDGFNDFVLFNYPEIITNHGTISIFNFNGRKVKEIIGDNRWYGKNDDGEDLSSGIYLYIVKIGGIIKANGTVTLVR
jgi:gliding motility-associated-like protein